MTTVTTSRSAALTGRFRVADPTDPAVAVLLRDLVREYDTRYPPPPGEVRSAQEEIDRYPEKAFRAPDGAFVLYEEDGALLAGGAFKRLSPDTAEIKRVWTHPEARGRGLAKAIMARLEDTARELGYQALFLTTGPNQAEAVALYVSTGYHPGFDPDAYPVQPGPHPFSKVITTVADPTTSEERA
ncbi:GNAT family N-acetyltransferase [Galactobacter sp.]|uniref:GNAT family N-acetyltransferase n=1 Tax=Galactobacter sp. TaxID=2676125 RepID=UPI0025BD307B|nr:GNAT family N-acetyltransferase [Galactobacter sp.]